MTVKELARAGTNTRCVDCSEKPLFGGMRCLTCFQQYARRREPGPPHGCGKHVPSMVCYVKCRCRCDGCRDVRRDYDRARR